MAALATPRRGSGRWADHCCHKSPGARLTTLARSLARPPGLAMADRGAAFKTALEALNTQFARRGRRGGRAPPAGSGARGTAVARHHPQTPNPTPTLIPHPHPAPSAGWLPRRPPPRPSCGPTARATTAAMRPPWWTSSGTCWLREVQVSGGGWGHWLAGGRAGGATGGRGHPAPTMRRWTLPTPALSHSLPTPAPTTSGGLFGSAPVPAGAGLFGAAPPGGAAPLFGSAAPGGAPAPLFGAPGTAPAPFSLAANPLFSAATAGGGAFGLGGGAGAAPTLAPAADGDDGDEPEPQEDTAAALDASTDYLFKGKAKLHTQGPDKKWADRGAGSLTVRRPAGGGRPHVVFTTDAGRILLNAGLHASLPVQKAKTRGWGVWAGRRGKRGGTGRPNAARQLLFPTTPTPSSCPLHYRPASPTW